MAYEKYWNLIKIQFIQNKIINHAQLYKEYCFRNDSDKLPSVYILNVCQLIPI